MWPRSANTGRFILARAQPERWRARRWSLCSPPPPPRLHLTAENIINASSLAQQQLLPPYEIHPRTSVPPPLHSTCPPLRPVTSDTTCTQTCVKVSYLYTLYGVRKDVHPRKDGGGRLGPLSTPRPPRGSRQTLTHTAVSVSLRLVSRGAGVGGGGRDWRLRRRDDGGGPGEAQVPSVVVKAFHFPFAGVWNGLTLVYI